MQRWEEDGREHEVMFSVIIPVYRVEDCLKRCVDSVLTQTFTDFEILLIDDGSIDACPAICDAYAKADKRVRVIHKPNGGLVSARNTGIRHAVGRYICYVDGDDWVAPNLLETMHRYLAEEQEPDMVVFKAYYEFDSHTEVIPDHVLPGRYDRKRLQKEVYPYMIYDASLPFFTGKVFPAAWNKIYRRKLLEEHYCRDEKISLAEDNAFTFECLYYAESVIFCEDVLYHYNRCNEGSMISRYNPAYLKQSMRMCRYVTERLSGKVDYLDAQLEALVAGWTIMSVFHEVRFAKNIWCAAKLLRKKVREEQMLPRISTRGLPLSAKCYLWLFRRKWYLLLCILTKLFC